jgi:hypothetical protein
LIELCLEHGWNDETHETDAILPIDQWRGADVAELTKILKEAVVQPTQRLDLLGDGDPVLGDAGVLALRSGRRPTAMSSSTGTCPRGSISSATVTPSSVMQPTRWVSRVEKLEQFDELAASAAIP